MRKRVLLVEDHPDTSDIIQRELSFVGYDVLIAENGLQAVAFAAHLLPDAIVMDMKLPKLNGHEATMRIRENPKTASIPILAATALTGPGERERGPRAATTTSPNHSPTENSTRRSESSSSKPTLRKRRCPRRSRPRWKAAWKEARPK